jgi:hypothetical protein
VGSRLFWDGRKSAMVILCAADWAAATAPTARRTPSPADTVALEPQGSGSGGAAATGGATGGSSTGGAGASGANQSGSGASSGSAAGGRGGGGASTGTDRGGSSGVGGEAGSEGGDGGTDPAGGTGGFSAGMGGVSPGGTSGASGAGGDTPDPYGPCDGSLGLQNNPDCPVENSNCQQGGCIPSCPDGATAECPSALGGTADAACRFELCYLVCGAEYCSSGMDCVGGVCRWP